MFPNLILAAVLTPASFDYDRAAPLHLSVNGERVSFAGSGGRTVTGILHRAQTPGKHAAVLFVHWLGDAATTNDTEFESDARALAARGADTLSIDAMWSAKNWFETGRSTATDARDSIAQVIDLRRSLDVLLSLPDVDPARVAYVGHDFGSMYGAVLAGVDSRPQYYVLMAGTTSFAQWYLLGKKPADVDAYRAEMAPFDPTNWLPKATAKAYLFQFSTRDEYITAGQEAAFAAAAPLPRGTFYYDVDHSLETQPAHADRLAWLRVKLGLQ